jgi:hypothetical protein
MQLCHTSAATSAAFDDPNLVSSAGLVPVIALARSAGLHELARHHLTVPTDKGANAGLKVTSLVAGMVAGADSIDDMALLRHGGMGKVFANAYAPSTLGSFLRSFTFGHVRQLDAVASRFLTKLAARTPLIAATDGSGRVMVDIDDTIIEVHGYTKQGSGYGYSGVRGLNALLATVSTSQSAPVVVAQRLRKGSCGSPRGAARLVADALKTVASLSPATQPKSLVRADSAFYGHAAVRAAIRGGADVSVTVRMDPKVKAAISAIGDDAWTPMETLFDTWRFHAFFTTTDHDVADTVSADKTHRGHAIIEQVHADLKHAALAHLPSGKFTANAAWLVLAVMAFNLTRAAATLTGPSLAKATTATIRRKLIAVPARVASSARRVTLHLPARWPWETAWSDVFNRACGPPLAPRT